MTEILPADLSGIARACELLDAGKTVSFPTETVYGLGGDATNPVAVAAIFAAKGRPAFNPMISHVAQIADAESEGVFDAACLKLAEAFWPGPLTLVLPLAPGARSCDLARAGLASIGLRCPDHELTLALLNAFGRPVAGPSANRSGHVSPTTSAHVITDMAGRIDAVIDAGPARIGIESTIIGSIDGKLLLLRPGIITAEAIEDVAGRRLVRPGNDAGAPVSPGRLAAHYAPATPVRLDVNHVEPGEALLDFGGRNLPGTERAHAVLNLSPAGNLAEAAANLYAFLRELDTTGATRIAVGRLPASGLGEAIMDRLRRAAAASAFAE